MKDLDRRTFLRRGLGVGFSGLLAVELPALLAPTPASAAACGASAASSERAAASVPLRLQYLGTVRLASHAPSAAHYHVYGTSHARTHQEHGALYILGAGAPAVAPALTTAALHPQV